MMTCPLMVRRLASDGFDYGLLRLRIPAIRHQRLRLYDGISLGAIVRVCVFEQITYHNCGRLQPPVLKEITPKANQENYLQSLEMLDAFSRRSVYRDHTF